MCGFTVFTDWIASHVSFHSPSMSFCVHVYNMQIVQLACADVVETAKDADILIFVLPHQVQLLLYIVHVYNIHVHRYFLHVII